MFWSGGLARFEPFTVKALRAAVEPGDTVYDVGAQHRVLLDLLSRLVGPEGSVVAFEPEPENLALLRGTSSATACRNVTVAPVRPRRPPGTATFSLDEATGSDRPPRRRADRR